MTRKEAIDRLHETLRDRKMVDKNFFVQDFVDALAALGLLDFEKPKTANTLAGEALIGTVVSVVYSPGHTSMALNGLGAINVIDALEAAGLKIVRKDAIK